MPGSPPGTNKFISLHTGKANLKKQVSLMNSPYAVLNNELCTLILSKRLFCPAKGTYPDFIFDKHSAIFILKGKIMSYVVLRSSEIFAHLLAEWKQLKSDISPVDKIASSQYFRTEKDGKAFEIYFSPKEIYFLSGGNNRGRIKYLWEKLYTKQELLLFFDYMEESKLFEDLKKHFFDGKTRFIGAGSSPFSDFVTKVPSPGFNFILSENSLTIFSDNPGDSQNKEKNYLNLKHGFVLHLELPISQINHFFEQIDFPLIQAKSLFLALKRKESQLQLNWNQSAETHIFGGPCSSDLKKIATVNSSSYSWQLPSTGYKYCFEIVQGSRKAASEILVPAEPGANDLVFTEFMWMGTYKGTISQAHDEWFEFKNITDKYLNLRNLSFVILREEKEPYYIIHPESSGSSHKSIDTVIEPGAYFVVSKDLDQKYLFRDLKLNNVVFRSGGQPNSENFTLQIWNNNTLISEQFIDHSFGLNHGSSATPPYFRGSMVRQKNKAWTNSNEPIRLSDYQENNNGSPGYGTENEF